MAEIPQSTIEDVFDDFDGRRSGILKALTTENSEQCLVGLPNGTWQVKPPARMVSPDHPRPVSGLHFGRNRMPGQVWAASIAACWDLWLLAFALYFDGRGLPKRDRINELATVCETVKEFGASNDQSAAMMLKKPGQSKSSGTHVNSSVDESRAQKDGIGAAIEDGHNDGSSSFAQSKCEQL
ncbi:hypothetical protein EUGRSUZ_G00055 [Eucalyptus grandis]|uniref:Uncharacterized protein n=2 Tax=Eucalyptus grandis TaxID=71139 RepID=A0ACC3JZJ5_EUCGR|nr:hypothetical protein EUGRSUZ_G00055 [Eucalyptus grandis]